MKAFCHKTGKNYQRCELLGGLRIYCAATYSSDSAGHYIFNRLFQQAIGSGFIPAHKFKANFLEYYEEYVKLNARKGNRHLINSLAQIKLFIKNDFIPPVDITENLCKRFRQHPIAKAILEKRKSKISPVKPNTRIFKLPSNNGSNKALVKWMIDAGITKYITWSCARLSFFILLQDKNVDDATVAYLMGHTTTDQVRKLIKGIAPKTR